MENAQWVLELALLLLLAATLFHALRLERALGMLKRDRAVLEELVTEFNNSTRQAENGIEKLRSAADGAGRQITRQIECAQLLRDDLNFLTDKGDRLAERLEAAVRSARMFADGAATLPASTPSSSTTGNVALLQTLQAADHPNVSIASTPGRPAYAAVSALVDEDAGVEPTPRLRSQAERDLLRVLRTGR